MSFPNLGEGGVKKGERCAAPWAWEYLAGHPLILSVVAAFSWMCASCDLQEAICEVGALCEQGYGVAAVRCSLDFPPPLWHFWQLDRYN